MNKCKCGKATRITFHDESYCWACYDEAMKAKDFEATKKFPPGTIYISKPLEGVRN